MLVVLSELFYSTDTLKQLQNTPGLTWTPGIPKLFELHSRYDIQALLLNVAESPPSVPATHLVGSTPTQWNWETERPECCGS